MHKIFNCFYGIRFVSQKAYPADTRVFIDEWDVIERVAERLGREFSREVRMD
jgi:hypothetical protein